MRLSMTGMMNSHVMQTLRRNGPDIAAGGLIAGAVGAVGYGGYRHFKKLNDRMSAYNDRAAYLNKKYKGRKLDSLTPAEKRELGY